MAPTGVSGYGLRTAGSGKKRVRYRSGHHVHPTPANGRAREGSSHDRRSASFDRRRLAVGGRQRPGVPAQPVAWSHTLLQDVVAVSRRRRLVAVLGAGSNQPIERGAARGRLDVWDGRHAELPLQPDRRRRHDVRARAEQLDRGARSGDRPGEMDAPERGRRDRSRHELLGERRRERPAPAVSERRIADGARRADRQHDRLLRGQRAHRRPHRPAPRCVTHPPAANQQSRAHLPEPDDRVAAGGRRQLSGEPG